MGWGSAHFLECLRTQSLVASDVACGPVCAIDEKTMTNVYTKSMKFDDFELARRYRL